MCPWLHFINFCSCKMDKIKANFSSDVLQSLAVFYKSFFTTKTCHFYKISYRLVSFMTEIFCSAWISQLPTHFIKLYFLKCKKDSSPKWYFFLEIFFNVGFGGQKLSHEQSQNMSNNTTTLGTFGNARTA